MCSMRNGIIFPLRKMRKSKIGQYGLTSFEGIINTLPTFQHDGTRNSLNEALKILYIFNIILFSRGFSYGYFIFWFRWIV